MQTPSRPFHRAQGFTLVEVMFAVGIVSFSFASLFLIYSEALHLVRNQRETMAAVLCHQERFEQIRSGNWTLITTPLRIQQQLLGASARASAGLSDLEEEITVSMYPPRVPASTPIRVRRRADGTTEILSQPADTTIRVSAMVRVDLRSTWRSRNRTRSRESATIVAFGGILR